MTLDEANRLLLLVETESIALERNVQTMPPEDIGEHAASMLDTIAALLEIVASERLTPRARIVLARLAGLSTPDSAVLPVEAAEE